MKRIIPAALTTFMLLTSCVASGYWLRGYVTDGKFTQNEKLALWLGVLGFLLGHAVSSTSISLLTSIVRLSDGWLALPARQRFKSALIARVVFPAITCVAVPAFFFFAWPLTLVSRPAPVPGFEGYLRDVWSFALRSQLRFAAWWLWMGAGRVRARALLMVAIESAKRGRRHEAREHFLAMLEFIPLRKSDNAEDRPNSLPAVSTPPLVRVVRSRRRKPEYGQLTMII